ncbi:2-hydroxyisoflavanone dehydratase-like [Curcuma longa]|uniref:2-hydroxyisoflavanone dehydratase-like n=1 Tax=Curcuma longa TaxID=136217 RepID=UPI003D9F6914
MAPLAGGNHVVDDFSPYFRVYKDGSVERLMAEEQTPASLDPRTGVDSKDVRISADVSARIYLPPAAAASGGGRKLPLVLYFRGGAFCMLSSASPILHALLNDLAAAASALILSVGYRRAPEHSIPVPYDDSWAALEWAASHRAGFVSSAEPWLVEHADFDRVCLAGDSAGGNIAHNLALRASTRPLPGGLKLASVVLVDPYFWGTRPTASEGAADPAKRELLNRLWRLVCPSTEAGNDDPRVNPLAAGAPSLAGIGCGRVLVCTAEKDAMRDRAWMYYEALRKSGWRGEAEMYETAAEDHGFYLHRPGGHGAAMLLKRIAAFLA